MFSFESEIPGDGRYNWEKSDFIGFNSGGAGLQVSFVIRIQEKCILPVIYIIDGKHPLRFEILHYIWPGRKSYR